jgi:molybdopterin-guanine dinucleotide biosynthesis protein A
MNETSGVIVAGGRSVRMGETEKALVEIAGTPLARRVADRLSAAVDRLVVNCRADQRDGIEAALSGIDPEPRFAIDPDPDRGPVAGIATGLRAVETEYAAVVAVDMPFLDPALLSYLFERAEGHDAAVPRPGEWFEPLHAVYRTEPMIEACERALETPHPRIIEPLSSIDRVVVDRAELLERGSLDSFEGVDTPEDVRWAGERFR